MKKNDERIAKVTAIGINGEGIVKDEDRVVFVPFALPNEIIKYKVLKITSKCVYGKLVEILEKSPDRVNPFCPVFNKCGGCQLQHISYFKQLEYKRNNIKDTFKKVAHLDVEVCDCVVGDSDKRYRNKLQLPIVQNANGVEIGFYAENSHRVIPITDCLINAEWIIAIISSTKIFMQTFNLKGYSEDGLGDIREVTAREIEGKLIITLVCLRQIRNVDKYVNILRKNLNKEFSLYININASKNNVIYGKEFTLIYGDGTYQGEMLGIKFPMSVESFMQVNTSVCKKLYSTVKQKLDTKDNSVVIDAYSGAGLMSALIAKDSEKVIGVEYVKEAVELSNKLAKNNNLDNVFNFQGKCEDIMPDIIAKEKQKGSSISLVIDPPRKGCDIKVINAILDSKIDRIVYVSCMPSTLARDVGLLVGTLKFEDGKIVNNITSEFNYKIEAIIPFDMFPHTKHVETLVVLNRDL